MADPREIEEQRKRLAGATRSELLHEKNRLRSFAPSVIAATQLLDELDQREEAQRHKEMTALSRQEIAASHYSNRLSVWAIGIAGVALLVAGLSLYLQWKTEAISKSHSPLSSSPPTNTPAGASRP